MRLQLALCLLEEVAVLRSSHIPAVSQVKDMLVAGGAKATLGNPGPDSGWREELEEVDLGAVTSMSAMNVGSNMPPPRYLEAKHCNTTQ